MRIDKFLKVSRIIKRRTVSKDACEKDRILINGKQAKPSKEVKIGDIVEVVYQNSTLKFRVLSVEDNVKKENADKLYEVLND
ncbi:MAG: RNA-binding S4 domain-containing protein [Clostridia bacterium]|mgnify:FL=1|nr:RNA-binding S4 domain-containing protein [Clostridia bacterium]MDY5263612.1 RNA-binding S4 domain-containing protein [Eubacteriales bacterium]MDY5440437.1 RNA-binding S4 domain-containing protein [Eubacteriales bacterium]